MTSNDPRLALIVPFLPALLLPAIPPDIRNLGLVLLTNARWELVTISPDSTTPGSLSNDPSITSQSDRSECFPDGTSVNSSSPDLVRLDDSVPSIKERRPTRLEFHSIHNKLESESVSVFGNKRGWLGRVNIGDGGVVIVGLRGVCGREEGL